VTSAGAVTDADDIITAVAWSFRDGASSRPTNATASHACVRRPRSPERLGPAIQGALATSAPTPVAAPRAPAAPPVAAPVPQTPAGAPSRHLRRATPARPVLPRRATPAPRRPCRAEPAVALSGR
jgi:hypothetical protein